MSRRWRRAAVLAAVCGVAFVPAVATAADTPDLSGVVLALDDLPDGFRLVDDEELEEAGGSAKQVADALEASLEEARLQRYLVYASASGDELIELVLVGPLVPREREGMTRELADGSAIADALTPSFSLYVEQSEPRLIDTAGVGEAAAGFAIDSRVTSDLATITNTLGVAWTEATMQYVLAIRGDYISLMGHQYVGDGEAQADFLGAVRHVDAHLAEALGLAEPGVYRPGGTFSPGVANNIPTAGDVSTEPAVVFANLLLAAVAVVALTIAMRLLNTTLVAHEEALEQLLRPARALGRLWTAADSGLARLSGSAAGVVRATGVLLFYGVLFSFLEDGWRPWTMSGLFVLVVMTIAFGIVGTLDDIVELRSARRWGMAARLAVKPALVLIAVGSVALTKVAGLVPGLMIGTPEAFSMEDDVDERNELRLARVGLGVTAAVGAGAWLLATPLDAALDGSSTAVQSLVAAVVTLLVLVFAVAVENLFANLLAFPGSEGATLRRHHRLAWWVCMLAVTGLFFHTLINPRGDLAESLESTNVMVVLGTVAAFLALTAVIRLWFASRDRRQRPTIVVPVAGAAFGTATFVPALTGTPAGAGAAAPPPSVPTVPTTPAPPPPAPPPPASPAHMFAAVPLEVARSTRSDRRRDPVLVVKLVATAVVLLGLAGVITVVVLQHRRDSDRFDAAHDAYSAGSCQVAVSEYDTLLGDSRLIDTAGVEGQATRERDECNAVLSLDREAVTDPASALAGYAAFVEEHPDSPLLEVVVGRVDAALDGDGAAQIATEANCDRLDSYQALGLLQTADVPPVQRWCAETYEAAGRDDDAYELALAVLQSGAGDDASAGATAIVLRNPAACADVDRVLDLAGLGARPDELAPFLQSCMATASAGGDLETLAGLQVEFLSRLPDHPEAPAVEAAVIANIGACALLDEMTSDPAVAGRPGFIPTMTFTCAQSAEYLEDYATAIARYQEFIDANPADERVTAARDGLARSLIAQARQRGAGELPAPTATGSSGSELTSVIIYNDSSEELRIVVSGPESRIEIMPASPTSTNYDLVGPLSCRSDVPTLELQVPAGDYQVLVEATSGGVSPFTGTWSLAPGDAYSSCFYIVTTFG